ncbi:MAG: hypothetical protein IH936_14845 [Acidobacteria bacterium]|nr:hypothetical protein [Acidobacteriota bacterium]
MPYTIRKSLVIGLGGTGRDAVLHVKKCCLDVFGEVPPTTRFFVIDTTDPEVLETKDGAQISLAAGEFKKLVVRDPGVLINENPEVKSWFPTDVPQRAITNGAGQIRALGRLALYSDPRLRDTLSNVINSINSWDVQRLGRESPDYTLFDDGDTLYVSLVTSLAGGTGSGSFLDIAFLLREMLQSTDKLTAYLLLPDVFQAKPATRNVAPNAYAALKELDHYMVRKQGEQDSFMFGAHSVNITVPFDFVYLVNNVTSDGTVYDEVSHLTEFLGRGIFMSMGASGKSASDIWDNLASQLTAQKKMQGKAAYLSSFGLSELVYDPSRFIERYTGELSVDLVRRLFLGEQVTLQEQVDDFMKENELREEGAEFDEVIDRLVKHREPTLFDRPSRADKRGLERMLEDRPGYLQKIQDRVNTETAKAGKTISTKVAANLGERVRRGLHRENGLAFCRSFLLELEGRLGSLETEMETERATYAARVQQEKDMLREIERDKEEVRGLFSRAAWEDLAQRLQNCTVNQAKWDLEKTRREEAARLFQGLTTRIKKELERLTRLRSLAEALVSDLNRQLEGLRRRAPKHEPFAKLFEPMEQDQGTQKAQVEDFLNWLTQQGTTVSNLPDLQIQEVKKLLADYAREQDQVKLALDRSIEEVLEELPAKERYKQISLLGQMAEPLWSYNKARTVGDHATELLFLIGTASEDKTVLSDPELDAHLERGPYPPQIVSTGDRYRITCLKIEAAVPAFILDGISRYRDRYRDPDRPFTYHTSDQFEGAVDLFPLTGAEEQRRWWALALAEPFNLIEQRGDYYYFKSEKLGRLTDDYMVKLAQGRVESMSKFLKDPKIIEETQRLIEETLRNKGNTRVKEALVAWMKRKGEEYRGRRMTGDIRDLVETELEEVERWISESLEELK